MAKRVALTALLPTANAALAVVEPPAASDAVEVVPAEAPEAPHATAEVVKPPRAPRATAPARTSAGAHQHFATLTRKEARLREDQIDALAVHARRLGRAKTGSDERITDNTLIRIAVDLLLTHSAELRGSTEAELRTSVGL